MDVCFRSIYVTEYGFFVVVIFCISLKCSLKRLYKKNPKKLDFFDGKLWWLSGKESTCLCKRFRFHPWVGRIPGEGNGNPVQYFYLGNPTEPGGYNPEGLKRLGQSLVAKQQHKTLEKCWNLSRGLWKSYFSQNCNYSGFYFSFFILKLSIPS